MQAQRGNCLPAWPIGRAVPRSCQDRHGDGDGAQGWGTFTLKAGGCSRSGPGPCVEAAGRAMEAEGLGWDALCCSGQQRCCSEEKDSSLPVGNSRRLSLAPAGVGCSLAAPSWCWASSGRGPSTPGLASLSPQGQGHRLGPALLRALCKWRRPSLLGCLPSLLPPPHPSPPPPPAPSLHLLELHSSPYLSVFSPVPLPSPACLASSFLEARAGSSASHPPAGRCGLNPLWGACRRQPVSDSHH